MGRPGMMVYFDLLGPLDVLSYDEKGRLFEAMLKYGKYGTEPTFEGMLSLAWGFVKPKIDKDSEEYNKVLLKRQYANVCKERKKKGEPEISFEEWLSYDSTRDHMVPHGATWYPTTTTSTTTNTTTATATAAAANTSTYDCAAATAPERNVRSVGGELGKNVVFLSEDQISDLLDKMGLSTFDYYVDKLSTFIIDNGAKVRNHYETILKWWNEDSSIRR